MKKNSIDNNQYLNKFYQKVVIELAKINKLRMESVLISFMHLKSNTRYSILNDSAIPSYKIPKDTLSSLLVRKTIRLTDRSETSYTITAQGIWEIEKNEIENMTDLLIQNIDGKFFNLFGKLRRLADREKIILFTMIALRSFSDNSCIDLKKGDRTLNELKALIEQSYDILNGFNSLKGLKREQIFGESGNEHPVSNLIRHTDALPKKTRSIYKAGGNQKYYLNVFRDAGIVVEDVSFLLWLIFGESIEPGDAEEIIKFFQRCTYEKGIYIFDLDSHIFANPAYDDCLRQSVDEYYYSRSSYKSAFD